MFFSFIAFNNLTFSLWFSILVITLVLNNFHNRIQATLGCPLLNLAIPQKYSNLFWDLIFLYNGVLYRQLRSITDMGFNNIQ